MNFKTIGKKITATMLMVMLVIACTACSKTANVENTTSIELDKDVIINIWYSDSDMTTYLESAAAKYHDANSHVTLVPTLVSSDEYLENIYNTSIKEGSATDLYLLSSDNIEKAYLMGLTSANDTYASTYSEGVYGKAAITASSYGGKFLGYPLTFDTAVMVYNKKYTNAKSTFQEITDLSDNFQHTEDNEEVEVVIKWDVSDEFLNYAMAGAYMNVGGSNSEDSKNIELQTNNVKSCMEEFIKFKSQYGMVRNTISLSGCIDSFTSNKLLYTIVKASDISKIDASGVNYGISKIPDLTSNLKTASMSTTTMVMVNPYSSNATVAKSVAKALTYDYADELNGLTGYISARGNLENNPSSEYNNLHSIYSDSIVKAKFMDIGDFYLRYEIMLHQVWDGIDVDTAYSVFSGYTTGQLGAKLK